MKLIDHYEIVQQIGQGGMATVYSARDTQLERMVALKVMHPHLRGSPEARARFMREAKTVARLEHPAILRIYEYGDGNDDECFIATELLTGPTLKQFIESTPNVPPEIVAAIGVIVAEALAAAHAQGVVHRDVKPENILFHEARTLKLTDFGIAQLLDAQTMTVTGQILGSPGHMAPEQVTSGDVDARTDIFSLGTTLYYLGTGELPFSGKNPHQVLRRITEGDYVHPLQLRPQLGADLCEIIVKCMQNDKASRFPDATTLALQLRVFLGDFDIENASEILAAYLRDSRHVSMELEKNASAKLVQAGRVALKHGAYEKALSALNRALAIDDNNSEALELIRSVGRKHRSRHAPIAAALGLALVGVIAAGGWALQSRGGRSSASSLRRGSSEMRKQSSPSAVSADRSSVAPLQNVALSGGNGPPTLVADASARAPKTTPVNSGSAGSGSAGSGSAGSGSAGSGSAGSGSAGSGSAGSGSAGSGSAGAGSAKALRPKAPVAEAPAMRKVVLKPFPPNVQIRVDNLEFRPYGPSFRDVDLQPGVHRFFVAGAYNCCNDKEFVRDIPPGREPFELPLRLELRPATLYVQANVPANVIVGDKLARGRTRALLEVPMSQSPSRVFPIRIEATGYETYTEPVRFQAGQIKEITVALKEAKKS